ncbi:glycosyltransferase [Methylomarinovum caldicuralii]|uniref:glycosyltransferase n=1 Tax=Methylomarinovum caldicuralii TaxID=438856 RepID=UPI002954011F|nr:glycosyltransferase [Methylomarinovum caldicuralii]
MLKKFQDEGFEVCLLFLDKGYGCDYRAMRGEWDGFYGKVYGKGFKGKLVYFSKRLLGDIAPGSLGFIDSLISRLPSHGKYDPLQIDAWYDSSIDEIVCKLKKENAFDVVLVEYVYLSKVLELFDDRVVKVIDAHDIFSNRHVCFQDRGKAPVFFYTSPEEEAKGFSRANLVLAIQDEDAEFISELSDVDVITVGHCPKMNAENPVGFLRAPPHRSLYVATNTVPNQDAMDFFLDNVWPRVLRCHPAVQLHVVGGICHYIRRRVDDDDNVHLHYLVNDLSSFYRDDYIVINPVRIGTGLKIKNIEALFMGKPLVTTSVGAQGLKRWINEAFLVADDAENFAIQLIKLLSDADACNALSKAALMFSSEYRREYEKSVNDLISRLT